MFQLLALIFIGWPAIIGSLLLSLLGVFGRRPWLCLAGAVLSLGFAWYLTGFPAFIFQLTGFLLPLFHLAAMFFVHRERERIAALFLLPHVVIMFYLLMLVLASPVP